MNETGRDNAIGKTSETGKDSIRQAADWLAGEVEFRLQKKWLVLAGAAVFLLVLFALD